MSTSGAVGCEKSQGRTTNEPTLEFLDERGPFAKRFVGGWRLARCERKTGRSSTR